MNTQKGSVPIIIGILVVIGVIGGILYFSSDPVEESEKVVGEENKQTETMEREENKTTEEKQNMSEEENIDLTSLVKEGIGSYEDYSANKIGQGGDVLIFFHAKWCPTCNSLDGDITRNRDNIPADLTILKADYDDEITLRQKYGVTVQHTLVQVDSSGNLVKKWTGSPTLSSLVSQVQ